MAAAGLVADALAEAALLRRADEVALPRQRLGVIAVVRQLLACRIRVGVVAEDVLHGRIVAVEDDDRLPGRPGFGPQQVDGQARPLADVQ